MANKVEKNVNLLISRFSQGGRKKHICLKKNVIILRNI